MKDKSKELEVAIQAVTEAAEILKKYFKTEVLKEFKEDRSVMTLADGESEEAIKKILSKKFPRHSILGEETGMTKKKSDYVWHIDPLDGTRNFANGIPLFAVSVALVYKKEIIVGVVYNPITRTLFYAEKGKGSYLNDKQISVSKDNVKQAMITVSRGKNKEDEKLFRELLYDLPNDFPSVRDLGCAALDLCYVARGGFEADIQIGLRTYDFAAGVLMVQEAGGQITKLDGSAWEFPNRYFIASNAIFHNLLVDEVMEQKEKLGISKQG